MPVERGLLMGFVAGVQKFHCLRLVAGGQTRLLPGLSILAVVNAPRSLDESKTMLHAGFHDFQG